MTEAANARLRRPQRILIAAVSAAVLLAVGALIGALWVKSPAQVAAETGPPVPTTITANVTREVLESSVVERGTVTARREIQDTPTSEWEAERLVITRIYHSAGSYLTPGEVILEVSGRPLIVLPGAVPAYRDLTTGDSGPDVLQLQDALHELGFGTGTDAAGHFGLGTSAAVAALYQAIGYQPPTTGGAHPQVILPMAEVFFVPSFPARILSISGQVGDAIQAPLVTVVLGKPTVTARVYPADGPVRAGMPVQMYDELTGWRGTGKVSRVGSLESGSSGPFQSVAIRPSTAIPASMIGANLQVTIITARSHGDVLAVPESALNANANGQDYVTVVTGQAGKTTQVRVPVVTGLSGGGMVALTGVRPGSLKAGDRVVIGVRG